MTLDWNNAPAWANVFLKHIDHDMYAWAEDVLDGSAAEYIGGPLLVTDNSFELESRYWQVVAQRPKPTTKTTVASLILKASLTHMEQRSVLRDAPDGERSMKRAIEAFNALEGTNLSEVQGWRFMALLKHARATQGKFCIDDYEDAAAYWALAGEAAQGEDQ